MRTGTGFNIHERRDEPKGTARGRFKAIVTGAHRLAEGPGAIGNRGKP